MQQSQQLRITEKLIADVVKTYGMVASIMARHDIEIGENAVIGAMGLVNKSIPADVTAVGVPCKVVNSSD